MPKQQGETPEQKAAREKKEADAKAAKEKKEPKDLEALSRADFTEYLIETIKDKVIAPIADQVGKVEKETSARDRKREVEAFVEKNPVAAYLNPEIEAVVKRNPEISIADAFQLAKVDISAERTKEIKEQIAKDRGTTVEELDKKSKAKEEGKEGDDENTIVSFFPRAASSEKPDGKMSSKDAGEDAWKQVFGSATELAVG